MRYGWGVIAIFSVSRVLGDSTWWGTSTGGEGDGCGRQEPELLPPRFAGFARGGPAARLARRFRTSLSSFTSCSRPPRTTSQDAPTSSPIVAESFPVESDFFEAFETALFILLPSLLISLSCSSRSLSVLSVRVSTERLVLPLCSSHHCSLWSDLVHLYIKLLLQFSSHFSSLVSTRSSGLPAYGW